mmetsp:Transcript_16014/g.32200  ORF Transcript_16014/g.32200 Transcript_16014/m.32200 type:complete len:388 (-) Transcript_16014:1299-2462(-)
MAAALRQWMSILSRQRAKIARDLESDSFAEKMVQSSRRSPRSFEQRLVRASGMSDEERRMDVTSEAYAQPFLSIPPADLDSSQGGMRFLSAALVGLANAGKSTLLNQFVGGHVAGVTRKRNTTRGRVVGYITDGPNQIVFYDSPGILARSVPLSEGVGGKERWALISEGWRIAEEARVCLLVVDGAVSNPDKWVEIHKLAKKLRIMIQENHQHELVLVVNKVDLAGRVDRRLEMSERIHRLNEAVGFAHTFLVSAKTGTGLVDIKKYLMDRCQPSPWLFDPGKTHGDSPSNYLCELVREQLLELVHDEIPYQSRLELECWAPRKDGSYRVELCIRVGHERHIPIVIGKNGDVIRHIQQYCAERLGGMFGRRVDLGLRVAVRKGQARL